MAGQTRVRAGRLLSRESYNLPPKAGIYEGPALRPPPPALTLSSPVASSESYMIFIGSYSSLMSKYALRSIRAVRTFMLVWTRHRCST